MKCSIDDCAATATRAGLCGAHYMRKRRHGDPLAGRALCMPVPEKCSVPDCGQPGFQRGYCKAHYKRHWKNGDALAGGALKAPQRKGANHCGKQRCPAAGKLIKALHYQRNKSAYISRAITAAHEDPATARLRRKKWRDKNPAAVRAHTRFRKRAIKQARPSWLTPEQIRQMDQFYHEARRLSAETGIEYHVDHEIPLNGKTVCGLDVPWNLRVLRAEDNLRRARVFAENQHEDMAA